MLKSPITSLFSLSGPFFNKETDSSRINKIVGFVDIDARESRLQTSTPTPYISDLIVAKPYRNLGIGMRLMKECELLCQIRKSRHSKYSHDWMRYDYLYLKVNNKNHKAIDLYKNKLGYELCPPREFQENEAGMRNSKTTNANIVNISEIVLLRKFIHNQKSQNR